MSSLMKIFKGINKERELESEKFNVEYSKLCQEYGIVLVPKAEVYQDKSGNDKIHLYLKHHFIVDDNKNK